MKLESDPRVAEKFESYPPIMNKKLDKLRELVISTAKDLDLPRLEETLKWGEPSYLCKNGSTIRMDWKEKNPDQYALYFKCTSKLVPTFRLLYPDTFKFEGNRALVFMAAEQTPEKELRPCIGMALKYHKLKDKPLLGA